MGWTLLSIMNVHKLAWAAADLPAGRGPRVLDVGRHGRHARSQARRLAPATLLLVTVHAWMCITLPFSFSVDGSMEMWKKVMKIDFMILVALVLITRASRSSRSLGARCSHSDSTA